MFTPLFVLLAQTPGVKIDLRSRKQTVAAVTDFPTAAQGSLRMILMLGAFAAFGYLVWGGMDWILSGGESSKIESARKKMTHAIIGLGLLAASAVIFIMVETFLGIGILRSGVGGTTGGGGQTGAGTCAGGVAINDTVNDGGAGGYCKDAAGNDSPAMVQCFGPGQGTSKFNYPHFDPVSCVAGGTKAWNW